MGEDTGQLQVYLHICGDPDNSGNSPRGGVTVTVNSSEGINWLEARGELIDKVVDWAMSFLRLSSTNQITIEPEF